MLFLLNYMPVCAFGLKITQMQGRLATEVSV